MKSAVDFHHNHSLLRASLGFGPLWFSCTFHSVLQRLELTNWIINRVTVNVKKGNNITDSLFLNTFRVWLSQRHVLVSIYFPSSAWLQYTIPLYDEPSRHYWIITPERILVPLRPYKWIYVLCSPKSGSEREKARDPLHSNSIASFVHKHTLLKIKVLQVMPWINDFWIHKEWYEEWFTH